MNSRNGNNSKAIKATHSNVPELKIELTKGMTYGDVKKKLAEQLTGGYTNNISLINDNTNKPDDEVLDPSNDTFPCVITPGERRNRTKSNPNRQFKTSIKQEPQVKIEEVNKIDEVNQSEVKQFHT